MSWYRANQKKIPLNLDAAFCKAQKIKREFSAVVAALIRSIKTSRKVFLFPWNNIGKHLGKPSSKMKIMPDTELPKGSHEFQIFFPFFSCFSVCGVNEAGDKVKHLFLWNSKLFPYWFQENILNGTKDMKVDRICMEKLYLMWTAGALLRIIVCWLIKTNLIANVLCNWINAVVPLIVNSLGIS